jgi:hypothetical protein
MEGREPHKPSSCLTVRWVPLPLGCAAVLTRNLFPDSISGGKAETNFKLNIHFTRAKMGLKTWLEDDHASPHERN